MKTRSFVKVVAFNVLLFFALLGMLFLLPPLGFSMYKVANKLLSEKTQVLPSVYAEYAWATRHFEEIEELTTSYYDHVVWQRDDFEGETITIKDGLRVTLNPAANDSSDDKIWFFGGSTIWGTGVNDANTISSIFAVNEQYHATNFGESSYIARQSLARLIQAYVNDRYQGKKTVIFYDGVNDVIHKCRFENSGSGSAREFSIRQTLKRGDDFSLRTTFHQLMNFLSKVRTVAVSNNLTSEQYYDCHSNARKAEHIAATLVNIWSLAGKLSKLNGDRFIAVLQPVAYFSDPDIGHLQGKLSDIEARQFQVVYPKILAAAKNRGFEFLDLTNLYDGVGPVYSDFCHVGPRGNRLVANAIANHLQSVETLPSKDYF